MPVYDYRCADCGDVFEQTETLAEHETSAPRCPKCRSGNVTRVFSSIQVRTSKKS